MLKQKTLCQPSGSSKGFRLASTQINYVLLPQMWQAKYILIPVKFECSERNLDLLILGISSKYQVNRRRLTTWTTHWTIQIPRYLITSEFAGHHDRIQIYLGGGGIPSLTIKYGIRFSKALTGRLLSKKKRFYNCCSKISIKGTLLNLL